MSSITLHSKYGVNPSIEVCFICGDDTGNLLLLGANRGKEAPMRMAAGHLCPRCQEVVDAGGVMLVEVRDGESAKRNANPYRTGFIIGVKREAIDADAIGKSPMAFVEENQMREMLGEELYTKLRSKAEDEN